MSQADRIATHPVMAAGILTAVHLLEADAGTGKTWTLTGLVIRALIEAAQPISAILVVTFTHAAVAELRERIRQALQALHGDLLVLQQEDGYQTGSLFGSQRSGDPFIEDYAARIAQGLITHKAAPEPGVSLAQARAIVDQAIACIDELAVFTLHGFCQRILTEYSMSTDVPSGLDLRADVRMPLDRHVAQWWRRHTEGLPIEQLLILEQFEVDLALLQDAVAARFKYPHAQLQPSMFDWQRELTSVATLKQQLFQAIHSHRFPLEAALINAPRKRGRKKPPSFDLLFADLSAWSCPGSTARWPHDELAALHPLALQEFGLSDEIINSSPIVRICMALSQISARLNGVVASMVAQAEAEIIAGLEQEQTDTGVIGYDDLLRFAHRALINPRTGQALALALRRRYPIALVDECQDNDEIQWEILRRIYPVATPVADNGKVSPHDAALIMVGDPKQAIYAFRGADVYAYLDIRSRWPGPEGIELAPHRHTLNENQRACAGLIDAINTVFGHPRTFVVPEITFSNARLGRRPRGVFKSQDADRRAPLCWIDIESEQTNLKTDQARILSARVCATEIAKLLQPGYATLNGRPLQPADIAVLVPRNVDAELIRRELLAVGLNAAQLGRGNVLKSPQADELVRVIAAIADPANPSLLRGALLTELLGCAVDQLEQKTPDAVLIVRQAEQTWRYYGPQRALRDLFEQFSVFERLATYADGERRLTNLLHLLELLSETTEASVGPAQAIRWLGRRRARSDGEDTFELRLESDDNLIRIVTIHRSKGLEYPVVFLPFSWVASRLPSSPQRRDRFRHAFAHRREANRWVPIIDLSLKLDKTSIAAVDIERKGQDQRLLYVAMTRAMHRLYVSFALPRTAKLERSSLGTLLLAAASNRLERREDKGEDNQASKRIESTETEPAGAETAPAESILTEAINALVAHGNGSIIRLNAQAVLDELSHEPKAPFISDDLNCVQQLGHVLRLPAVPIDWLRSSFSAIHRTLVADSSEGAVDVEVTPSLVEQLDVESRVPSEALEIETLSELEETEQSEPDADLTQLPITDQVGDDICDRFPAGGRAGTCLHAILERVDFQTQVDPGLIKSLLDAYGFGDQPAEQVAIWLDQVIDTPLPHFGATLRAVHKRDYMRELEFNLRVEQLDTDALVKAVQTEYPLDGRAPLGNWRGYLQGFIDVVIRRQGRYYLIDWKSNRLNRSSGLPTAALTSALDEQMRRHGYYLQMCLYTLALHRHLRARVPHYDYGRDIGGAYNVFLRGATAQSATQKGVIKAPGAAVVYTRPSFQLINRLDQLLRGGAYR